MKATFKIFKLTSEQIIVIEKLEGEGWEFKDENVPTSIEAIDVFSFKSPRCKEFIDYNTGLLGYFDQKIESLTEEDLRKYEAWKLACDVIHKFETALIGQYISNVQQALLNDKNLNPDNFKFEVSK